MTFAPKFIDLVRNTSTTIGTDDFVLGPAVSGFASFTSACAVGDCFYYSALGVDNPADTEVGRGTMLAGGVIGRDPISGTKTNFSSGTKSVSLIAAAEWFAAAEAARASAGPVSVRHFGAKGDGSTDDTAAIQAALDHVDEIGGGALYFPEGVYTVSSYLTVHRKTLIRGAGRQASIISCSHAGGGGANAGENLRNGSGLVTAAPLNSSTSIYLVLEDIGIVNGNPANVGAAYYDTCGTFIACRNVGFGGFKYGAVLDQSELADFDLCEFGSQNAGGAGLWIVNGADLSPGASNGFSNRISVQRSQFNQGAGAHCVVDDGGYAHVFEDNNYNGGISAIHAAGVSSLDIRGGEFESATSHCIVLSSMTRAGAVVGGSATAVRGGSYNATAGNASIFGEGAPGTLHVDGIPLFSGGGGTHAITNAPSFAAIWLLSYGNNTGLADGVKDGAAHWVDVDLNGGSGLALNGVTCANGAVAASNIGTAAAHASEDLLHCANNLTDVPDKFAAAKHLGTGIVLAQSGVGVGHSGDTNPFTLASVTLPANAMGANGQLVVEALYSMNNSPNAKTVQILFGGNAITNLSIASQFGTQVHARLANQNAPNAQVGQNSAITGYGNNNRATYAVDTTQAQTISFVGTLTNATDSVKLESYQVVLYPKD